MDTKRQRLGWVFFSLFVWLHFVQNVFPLPSQRDSEIEVWASEAVATSNELAEKGFERDESMQMSKEEWEAKLTASYWATWIVNIFFLLIGLVATFLLYSNKKWWPIFLGVSAFLAFTYFLLPYMRLESPFSQWKSVMTFALKKSHYSLAYYSSIWHMYFLILLIFSIWSSISTGRKNYLLQ